MPVDTIEELEALYGAPSPRSLSKVVREMTPAYQRWVEASRFVILSTVGPEGVDASPRGDDGPALRIKDASTLLLPDWRGNNRLDSLRNIVRDGRASLMLFARGSTNVVRINGKASLSVDPELLASFEQKGRNPTTVIVFTIEEMYFQCAKAIMRAKLWSGEADDAPSAGDLLNEVDSTFDGKTYDDTYPEYAETRMW